MPGARSPAARSRPVSDAPARGARPGSTAGNPHKTPAFSRHTSFFLDLRCARVHTHGHAHDDDSRRHDDGWPSSLDAAPVASAGTRAVSGNGPRSRVGCERGRDAAADSDGDHQERPHVPGLSRYGDRVRLAAGWVLGLWWGGIRGEDVNLTDRFKAIGEHAVPMLKEVFGDFEAADYRLLDIENVAGALKSQQLRQCHNWLLGCAVWYEVGQPVVTADSTLLALLACTPTGPIASEDLVSPFGPACAFWFDPPIPTDSSEHCRWLLFATDDKSRSAYASWGVDETPDVLNGCALESHDIAARMSRDTMYELAIFRVAIGLSRLIKSAPPGTRKTTGPAPVEIVDRGVSKKKGTRSILVRRLFVVEQSIADACRAALRGGPRAPCLRHLVRGHWRNQACGTGRKERELMWIQPHWRGTMKDFLRPIEVRVM
jgi:hypothetical protein